MNRYSVSIGQDLSKNMSFSGVTKKNPEQTIHKLCLAFIFGYIGRPRQTKSVEYEPKLVADGPSAVSAVASRVKLKIFY